MISSSRSAPVSRLALALACLASLAPRGIRAQYSPGEAANDAGLLQMISDRDASFAGGSPSSSSYNSGPAPVPVYFPPGLPALGLVAPLSASGPVSSRPASPDFTAFAGHPAYPALADALQRATDLFPRNRGLYGRAPAELASYVNEPFYAALAARLSRGDLSAQQRAELDHYRDDKHTLQEALHAQMGPILGRDATTRTSLLAALAREQEPKLTDLAIRAEALRLDLANEKQSWGALRRWRLGDSPRTPDSAEDVAGIMLDRAYFQKGLSAEQRSLLREIALDLGSADTAGGSAVAAQPGVFFSPDPIRVVFPTPISTEVGAKLAAYRARKSALSKALYDAVYREDSVKFAFIRAGHLKALAERQAPEFAALETLAEEVRRDFAASQPPPPRSAPLASFTPELTQRVIVYSRHQAAAQSQFLTQVGELRDHYPMLRVSYTVVDGHATFQVNGSAFDTKDPNGGYARAKQEVAAISRAHASVAAELATEEHELRRDLAKFLPDANPAAVTAALNQGSRLAAEARIAEANADYRVAILEPGLSPGQRRLLVDRAVENFALPLPVGELQARRDRSDYSYRGSRSVRIGSTP